MSPAGLAGWTAVTLQCRQWVLRGVLALLALLAVALHLPAVETADRPAGPAPCPRHCVYSRTVCCRPSRGASPRFTRKLFCTASARAAGRGLGRGQNLPGPAGRRQQGHGLRDRRGVSAPPRPCVRWVEPRGALQRQRKPGERRLALHRSSVQSVCGSAGRGAARGGVCARSLAPCWPAAPVRPPPPAG